MGDVDHDDRIKYVGQNNDRDPVLQNVGGSVPTSVKEGRLPWEGKALPRGYPLVRDPCIRPSENGPVLLGQ